MSEEVRGNLTIGLWFITAVMMAALFISAAAQGELTDGHIGLAIVMLTLVTSGTITIWRWKGNETDEEKAKRSRVTSLLRDLSDDELVELKHRLSDIDEISVDSIGDDGEFVRRR